MCLCAFSVPDSQISLHFTLGPIVFKLQAIFMQVHHMTHKSPQMVPCKRYPIYVLLGSLGHKLQSDSLYRQQVSSFRPFWDKCTDWPQKDLGGCEVIVPHICSARNPSTKFESVTIWPAMLVFTVRFELSAPNTLKWPLAQKSHVPHICATSTPKFKVSILFSLRPTLSSYRPFWNMCTDWSQKDLEYNKVKVTPCMICQ